MGQSPSHNNSNLQILPCTTPRRRSFRSPFLRRKKHKHPLSATFQATCTSNFEALNINTATVEQFMTLPGINRRIAQSIVEHRNAIGGRFQRIDDLALVSGIGAEKLDQIRPEIGIKRLNRSTQGSSLSSRTPSLDSLFSEPITNNQKVILNVNTSTVFQLQQIHGMNQEIAANVVDYRNRKGKFKSLDDLVKVKGLSHVRLGAIRSSLCVNDNEIPKTPKLSHSSTPLNSASTPLRNGYNNHIGHRKSMSVPIKMNVNLVNGFINAPVNDIFDLLGAYSHRPVVEENYNFVRHGHGTIRVSSWNLDKMTVEKSSNLGVKEVICRTILENKLSILCFQEVLESNALQQICDELNTPTLRRVNEWKENSKNWKYLVNSTCQDGFSINGLGILYDCDRCKLIPQESFDIPLGDCTGEDLFISPTAYLVAFKLSDWTCYILNTYLRYFNLDKIDNVIKTVDTYLKNRPRGDSITKININDIFFVAGDFTGINMYDNLINSSASLSTIELIKYSILYNNNTNITINNNNSNNSNNNTNTNKLIKYKKNINNVKDSQTQQLSSITTALNLAIEELGFFKIIDANFTSFNKDQPLLHTNTIEILSSCNILCREKMPSLRSAFREALYKTKSPLTLLNNPETSAANSSKQSSDVTTTTTTTTTSTKNESNKIKLCGYYGIIRQGLCHMAIPRGWTWGGPISEHCPIWVEIFMRKDRNISSTLAKLNSLSDIIDVKSSNFNNITNSNGNTNNNSNNSNCNNNNNNTSKNINNNNNRRLTRIHSLGSNNITKLNGFSMTHHKGDLDLSTDSVFVKSSK